MNIKLFQLTFSQSHQLSIVGRCSAKHKSNIFSKSIAIGIVSSFGLNMAAPCSREANG
jgi:hypothetical protein